MSLDYATICEGMSKPSFIFDGRNILPLDELKVREICMFRPRTYDRRSYEIATLFVFLFFYSATHVKHIYLTHILYARPGVRFQCNGHWQATTMDLEKRVVLSKDGILQKICWQWSCSIQTGLRCFHGSLRYFSAP